MPSQAHRIKIEADQQSAFGASTTAEGWSSWLTPGGDRRFHRRIRDRRRTLVLRLRHSAGVGIDPTGRMPSHTHQEPVIVRLSEVLDRAVWSHRAFSGGAPPHARRRSGREARPDCLAHDQASPGVAVGLGNRGELS